jgi:hypothetical protein
MPKTTPLKPLAFAKLLAIIGALLGLLAGILYSFGGLIIDTLVTLGWITTTETPGLSYGTVLAFGALIGMPIIFAIFGFVAGIVGAFLYNLTSKWFNISNYP